MKTGIVVFEASRAELEEDVVVEDMVDATRVGAVVEVVVVEEEEVEEEEEAGGSIANDDGTALALCLDIVLLAFNPIFGCSNVLAFGRRRRRLLHVWGRCCPRQARQSAEDVTAGASFTCKESSGITFSRLPLFLLPFGLPRFFPILVEDDKFGA